MGLNLRAGVEIAWAFLYEYTSCGSYITKYLLLFMSSNHHHVSTHECYLQSCTSAQMFGQVFTRPGILSIIAYKMIMLLALIFWLGYTSLLQSNNHCILLPWRKLIQPSQNVGNMIILFAVKLFIGNHELWQRRIPLQTVSMIYSG